MSKWSNCVREICFDSFWLLSSRMPLNDTLMILKLCMHFKMSNESVNLDQRWESKSTIVALCCYSVALAQLQLYIGLIMNNDIIVGGHILQVQLVMLMIAVCLLSFISFFFLLTIFNYDDSGVSLNHYKLIHTYTLHKYTNCVRYSKYTYIQRQWINNVVAVVVAVSRTVVYMIHVLVHVWKPWLDPCCYLLTFILGSVFRSLLFHRCSPIRIITLPHTINA